MRETLHDRLVEMAKAVKGTEAIAFAVQPDDRTLDKLIHIRPDNSGQQVRAEAESAFRAMVAPCVEHSKDGAICVSESSVTQFPQFCLVTLIRERDETRGAVAIVARAADDNQATQLLEKMRAIAP